MLFHAAHMSEDGERTADPAKRNPELAHYVHAWGRPGDVGVIAEARESGSRIGAAWVRLLSDEPHSIAYVDAATPELAIAVVPDWAGKGVGSVLLDACLRACQPLYASVALSVRGSNPARRLYERAGFEVVRRAPNRVGGESLIMIVRF